MGKSMSQSLGVITYAKTSPKKKQNNNEESTAIPRYLKLSSNSESTNAYEIKKKMLMSKYIHEKFEPGFETEFAKAYYDGVENAAINSDENITELIWRLGRYKGKIKPHVRFRYVLIL